MISCQWDHPQISHKPALQQRSLRSGRRAVCCPKTQPDTRRRTDRRTVWCQLSPLSFSRHHSSSCCYGQPTPPWQPTGCKSGVRGRKRKREFVCHAITFKSCWHVSESLFSRSLHVLLSLQLWPFVFLAVFVSVLLLSPTSVKLWPVVTGSTLFCPLFSSRCTRSNYLHRLSCISTSPPLCSYLSSLARLPRSRPLSGAAPCARLRGLTPGQVGVCRARGEVMESVRKAAEMVIEEVHIKGNSKCFLFMCVWNAGQFYTRPVSYLCAEVTAIRPLILFCTVQLNNSI